MHFVGRGPLVLDTFGFKTPLDVLIDLTIKVSKILLVLYSIISGHLSRLVTDFKDSNILNFTSL